MATHLNECPWLRVDYTDCTCGYYDRQQYEMALFHTRKAWDEREVEHRAAVDRTAAALRTKNAELVHVLKQLREVIQPSVPALIRSYLDLLDPGVGDRLTTQKVLHRVERVGREIDDALIAYADDTAVKERAELQRQLAEARAAAEVQADALAEQAADMERLRRRLDIEFEKTRAMTRALGEVWEQVPDADRIGKPADQWVRGLGRRVRELTAAPLGRGCDCGTPSTIHDVACPSAEDERTI